MTTRVCLDRDAVLTPCHLKMPPYFNKRKIRVARCLMPVGLQWSAAVSVSCKLGTWGEGRPLGSIADHSALNFKNFASAEGSEFGGLHQRGTVVEVPK